MYISTRQFRKEKTYILKLVHHLVWKTSVEAPMWIGKSNVFNSIKDASMHDDDNAV